YQVSREIGACAAVLAGAVDAVVLTGGMARDEEFISRIKKRIALSSGAERVLCGEEAAGTY
ncbi:MAG: butyrate kinase, partial [Acidobacteria bacterium]|nr:butyrate kinase [Acidobacteriota bacterium]